MDYTRSKDHVVHTGTGNRMHDDTQPNTTVFSANDVNQVNWSLMEVIKAAGLEGKTFNPDDASSYHVLQNALKAQFAPIGSEPDVMTGATESSGGTSGLVPAPIAGDGNKFLAGDGTFKYVSGVPVGTIEYFATSTPPAGYLKADGAAVGRETYPDLFAAIGTAFGEGDGSTTFNLPDLIDRFAQGSDVPGQKLEAGLPNAIGKLSGFFGFTPVYKSGALSTTGSAGVQFETIGVAGGASANKIINLDLSESNPIYGASSTVQPPALTLLPCIKAFDAATDPGLIDITELAQEMADKTDKMTAANAAMPSDRYVDLTLPVSLSTITAPADGYIFFEKITTAANQYVALYVNAPDSSAIYGANNDLPAANAYPFVLIPVKKGAVVTVEHNAAGTYTRFRFIYANGSVQQ